MTTSIKPAERIADRSTDAADIRRLIPPLGFREYWYPALEERKVKRRPVGLKICGVDLVFFRGADGRVKCLWNVCPHRGGSLMHGDCHFKGTISCPYHGWTFDGDGNVLAVLPEGPDSQVPGKVTQRAYPTVTLKGMVFVWMGEGAPAPLEEDIPPEFFDDHTTVLHHVEMWPVNWHVSLENGGDAHVPYVHRDSVRQLMGRIWSNGPRGSRQKTIAGRAVVPDRDAYYRNAAGGQPRAKQPYRRFFPALNAHWPKRSWRLLWSWIWWPNRWRLGKLPAWDCPEEWVGGHHLPGMYRGDHKTDLYTRHSVPVTEGTSRQIYYKAVRPRNWVGRVYERVFFRLYWRWAMYTNFSTQDLRAVAPQRYDTAEFLSPTDAHVIVWRRLALQARGMMTPEAAEAVDVTPAEAFATGERAPERPNS